MTSQIDAARLFRSLHRPTEPIVLYNIWDAGSAVAVARAGARAIATGSWSVAAAQGHADGEEIALDAALAIAARIVANVDLPVTVDFEGGYASDPVSVGENVRRLLAVGAIGLNFEDQVVDGPGLHAVEDQVARLRAVRKAADDHGIPAFVNARTDVFLKAAPDVDHAGLVEEALAREAAYAEAGADGFFVPGLKDKALIRRICEEASLPVNIMVMGDPEEAREIAALGVARISLGPAPYMRMTAQLERDAGSFF